MDSCYKYRVWYYFAEYKAFEKSGIPMDSRWTLRIFSCSCNRYMAFAYSRTTGKFFRIIKNWVHRVHSHKIKSIKFRRVHKENFLSVIYADYADSIPVNHEKNIKQTKNIRQNLQSSILFKNPMKKIMILLCVFLYIICTLLCVQRN